MYQAPMVIWPIWQHEYLYGLIFIMPPAGVIEMVWMRLRQRYHHGSTRICQAHFSLSEPLPRPLMPELLAEVRQTLATIEPSEVRYGRLHLCHSIKCGRHGSFSPGAEIEVEYRIIRQSHRPYRGQIIGPVCQGASYAARPLTLAAQRWKGVLPHRRVGSLLCGNGREQYGPTEVSVLARRGYVDRIS